MRLRSVMAALAVGMGLMAESAGAAGIPEPEVASYRQILANKAPHLKLFQWDGNPRILLLDFPTLGEQADMFNRIVALVERMGVPRDRVLTTEELSAYIKTVGRTPYTFALGNDFRVSELVTFFNLLDYSRLSPTAGEAALRDYLLSSGYMGEKFGFYQLVAPDRVILSIPQEQAQPIGEGRTLRITAAARTTILRHELSHGEYYANKYYTDYCRQFWRFALSPDQRQAFVKFLGDRSYDTNNAEMMVNEGQAYLFHTPDPGSFSAKAVGLEPAELDTLRKMFMDYNPPTPLFEAAK